ncbi:MAG: PEP-CTERM sorting domain-containing protein [Bryobacterales bacterium]|nr:PEP-CTERM sorting domain-containing protein [Bryobacterales bacterium]
MGRLIFLQFVCYAHLEPGYDGVNLVAAAGVLTSGSLAAVAHLSFAGAVHSGTGFLWSWPSEVLRNKPGANVSIAQFELSTFAGETVNILMQFGSDRSAVFPGINIDNVMVSSVPEPTTLSLFLLASGAGWPQRKRMRRASLTAFDATGGAKVGSPFQP